jgi:hypothetical protein
VFLTGKETIENICNVYQFSVHAAAAADDDLSDDQNDVNNNNINNNAELLVCFTERSCVAVKF